MAKVFLSGWRPSSPDHRDHVFSAHPKVLNSLPAKVDLSQPSLGMPFDPCWDQSQLGSCGAFTAAENICYDEIADKVNPSVRPSPLFVYYIARLVMGTITQDSGVDNRSLMKALNQYGWCDETLWPYLISKFKDRPTDQAFAQAATRKIKGYEAIPQDLDQMKACLAGGGENSGKQGRPFIFGFTVYSSFQSTETSRTGYVPIPRRSESVLGGHDVLIVGYDDATQRFKFKNHYSPEWGDNGYGTIDYKYATASNLSGDFWSAKDSANVPVDPVPVPEPTTTTTKAPVTTLPPPTTTTTKAPPAPVDNSIYEMIGTVDLKTKQFSGSVIPKVNTDIESIDLSGVDWFKALWDGIALLNSIKSKNMGSIIMAVMNLMADLKIALPKQENS